MKGLAQKNAYLKSIYTEFKIHTDMFEAALRKKDTAKMTLSKDIFACPECGHSLQQRKGSKGVFWGCTGYPECKTTLPDDKGKPGQRVLQSADVPSCSECGGTLKYFKSKTSGNILFACFANEKHSSGKPHFWEDDKGKTKIYNAVEGH